MLQRFLLLPLIFVLSSCLSRAAAQSAALEAELPKALNADALVPGASFALKVTSPWKDGHCVLSPGEVLHALVQRSEHNAKGKTTSVTFKVQVPCGEEQPLHVVVTSLLAPTEVELLSQQFFHGSSFGESTGFGTTGIKQGDEPDMSGRQNSALPSSSGPRDTSGRPSSVHLGEVVHLSRIKLTIPTPGTLESTITTTGASLSLPARTTFVLQSSRMESVAPALTPARFVPPRTVSATSHALLRACIAGQCTRSSPGLAATRSGVQPLGTPFDLAPLGFRSEGDHDLKELESGATVHFLSDEEVLVTFPSHQLVKRAPGAPWGARPRSIRAALLDVPTSTLRSVQNWEIQDSNPYVWGAGDGVLVHEDGALKLYGPGLEEMASYSLDGPLSAMRVSPDGTHLLVGQIHELHTSEEHGLLVQADARGPEEEVRWYVLDHSLRRPKAWGASSTFRLPPVLLNEGLVELRKEGTDRYHLVTHDWTLGPEVQLGSFESACVPSVESTRPDLLLLETCNLKDLGAHSTFLHPDGAPVLDEAQDWHDLPLASVSASEAKRLAFAVLRGKEDYVRGRPFRLGSVRSEAAEVIDAETGATLASVPLPAASPYRQTIALSPNGHRLAILSGNRLYTFDVRP